MSHLALYRQFRPKTFDEVIAQNHIVETLRHQVQNGTISHAYLFCGSRGTGKTSCAKIFAKAVNCLNPKNGSPCGECEVCKKIDVNGNFDIMEIDAASNNRVDEIRDLREKVNYLPSIGKYKVYIIDEVHMLTDSAFNALLKTLEEPPSHIIFILATTEPEKLPATILSRCMRFDFKLASIDDLSLQLKKVFESTNTQFEPKALELIAKAGNGSIRDTLSVAEMCKAFSNNNITYSGVEECLGLTDETTLYQIALSIAQKNGGNIIKKIDELYDKGKNMSNLLSDICDFFKNVLTIKLAGDYNLKVPQHVLQNYLEISKLCDEKYFIDVLKRLADSMSQLKFSFNSKVFVEVTLLSLFYNENLEIELLKNRVALLEQGNNATSYQSIQPTSQSNNASSQSNLPYQDNDQQPQILNETNSHLLNTTEISSGNAKAIFGELIGHIRSSGEMLLFSGLSDVTNVNIKNDCFIFTCKNEEIKNLIDQNKILIVNFLKDRFKLNNIQTDIFVDEELESQKKLFDMLDGKLTIKN